MKEPHDFTMFKTVNEEIKTALRDLDEKLSNHPYFDFEQAKTNNESFLQLLDQLMDARCKIETLKQVNLSGSELLSQH